ncbi:MAG: hypothetical protein KDH94_08220, partial [Coxiellaceae bacterium]|nr:hypothetical protein [Coxiellaceae bacterium]
EKVQLTKTRSDYGLPESSFVFCCFNNHYKIDPTLFAIWMQLLKDLPNAVLWLLDETEFGKANLLREATKHRIDETRLIFAQRVSRQEHIARHQLADIYLDTFRVSARTSASDALWAGLPIITLPGNHFCNRVGASLVSAMNLPELIANSPDDYYNKAKFYAENPKQLTKLQKQVAKNLKSSALFNTKSFVKHLESAFKIMWQRYTDGEATSRIEL